MGFRPKRRIYKLDFTGTEDEGLEVTMRGPTVGEEFEISGLREQEDGGRRIFELMAGLLQSWNVEDEHGQPVATSLDGVRSQDAAFIGRILNALQLAASQVADPLPNGSPSGEPSPVGSIPMEALSPSPQSYDVPA